MTKLQFSDLRDIKRGRGRGGWLAESFTVMGSLPVSFMLESRTFISQKELGINTASAAWPANRLVLPADVIMCRCFGVISPCSVNKHSRDRAA